MEKDFDWGEFFEDGERFADFVNQEGFDGQEIVHAEQIDATDPKVSMRIRDDGVKRKKRNRSRKVAKFRDNVRRVALGTNFVIVDVEAQEEVDFSYPLRDLGYVYGEYERQAGAIRRQNRDKKRNKDQNKNGKAASPGKTECIREMPQKSGDMRSIESGAENTAAAGEYLYRFTRYDRLRPTVVFLLYSGIEEWQGPTDLYRMMDLEGIPEKLKTKIQNHRINLVDIHRMTDEQLQAFRTDVGKIFRLIRYSEEKEKLAEIVKRDAYYSDMPKEAYMVAANYIKAVQLIDMEKCKTESEGYDMCTAIRELIEDGRAEGRAEGFETGKIVGYKDAYRLIILKMIALGKDMEEISRITGYELDKIEEIRKNPKGIE